MRFEITGALLVTFPARFPRAFILRLAFVWVWVLPTLSANAQGTHSGRSASLHTLSGIYLEAELSDWKDGKWSFRAHQPSGDPTNSRETIQVTAGQEFVRWGRWKPPRSKQSVWLADGSWISGSLEVLQDGISISGDWFKSAVVPKSAVRACVLNPPAAIRSWVAVQSRLAEATGDEDQLWLMDGTRLSGILNNSQDPNQLVLAVGSKTATFDVEEVSVIVFSPTLRGTVGKPIGNLIGLRDGTLICASEIIPTKTGSVEITSQAGITFESFDSPTDFCEAIDYLSNDHASCLPMGQLSVASYRHVAANTLTWQLGMDQDCLGRPLRYRDGIVHRGLAMHSESQAAFRWDGRSAKFLAELCFAPVQQGGKRNVGHARCQVLVARNGKLETAFDQLAIRSEVPEIPVEVDVTDAQLIVLTTRQAQFGQAGDHVQWLDARITLLK